MSVSPHLFHHWDSPSSYFSPNASKSSIRFTHVSPPSLPLDGLIHWKSPSLLHTNPARSNSLPLTPVPDHRCSPLIQVAPHFGHSALLIVKSENSLSFSIGPVVLLETDWFNTEFLLQLSSQEVSSDNNPVPTDINLNKSHQTHRILHSDICYETEEDGSGQIK